MNLPRLIPVHWTELEKVVLKMGLRLARQKGSHCSYTKPGLMRPVVIPESSEISIIKGIIETLGISRQDYFRLLNK
ncbi:MAG: type II toxin-antitoxin system HicA family toxin [Deltaproteobacteria bacterium]|nr:type II toxin-antitoxin system HicA family toxin [Deltaproteobacteria bacterium]